MLLTSYIKVTMNKGNLDYYNKAMNSKFNTGDEIDIPIELIPKSSYVLVDFFIKSKNLICEVKSSYTYNYDIELNEAKKIGAIKNGYNFIFIIDKNYEEFDNYFN